jgi:hypothetical protein
MRTLAYFILFWMIFVPIIRVNAQVGDQVILNPRSGEALQGLINISGSTGGADFVTADLSFTYANDTTGTWFLISTVNQPVMNSLLALWDTTQISDGNYVLRFRVYLVDGTFRDFFVAGLRVRNYTSVETPTPTVPIPEATSLPTTPPTSTPIATPTLLLHNKAVLSPNDVNSSFLLGGLVTILILFIMSIYLWARQKYS